MNTPLSSFHLRLRPDPHRILAFIRTSALCVLALSLTPLSAPAKSDPIDVGEFPTFIAADPVRNFVYVAAGTLGNGTIFAIDTKTNAPVYTLFIGAVPLGVAISPDGQLLYVSTDNNTLDVFSLDLREFLYSYTTGSTPGIPGVSPDGSIVFVPNRGDGTVSAFEGELLTAITTGGAPMQVAFTPDGKNAYVTTGVGISVINIATLSPTPISGLTEGGFGLAITPNGSTVYVTSNLGTIVYAIATSDNSVTPITVSITGLDFLNFPAMDTSGKFLYVPASSFTRNINEVLTVETKTNAIFNQTIDVGFLPQQVAIKGKFGYCTNVDSNTVSVFKVK